MELLERVAFGTIEEKKWECPFAHSPSKGIKNKLNKSSRKLGAALENGYSTILWTEEGEQFAYKEDQVLDKAEPWWPKDKEIYPRSPGDDPRNRKKVEIEFPSTRLLPYSGAAHHIIPTNGSLM